jgi:transcriptional regulator with GAF, ATPase, and Fis domain
MQAKLLRAVQEQELKRIGDTRTRKVKRPHLCRDKSRLKEGVRESKL